MNPGMLDTLLVLEAPGPARGPDGAVLDQWDELQRIFARRMRPRGGPPATDDEPKDQETRRVTFRVRRRPFLDLYRNGCRFRETGANNLPGTSWRILSWSEVEGTRSSYVDCACEAFSP